MIGCPEGLYDEVNNIPIVRSGITATPLRNRFEGRDEFLVDMACFPGSSGSPVFIFDRNGFTDRAGCYHVAGQRLFLVGVLFAGPQTTNEGTIVLGRQPRVEVAAMMHLGQVVRSTAILDIEKMVREKLGAGPIQP